MNIFDDREKAFEAKYHHDEEAAFRVNARRDKLLGLWVAEKLVLVGGDAETYALSAVESDLSSPAHAGLLAKLQADLDQKQVGISSDILHQEFDRLLSVAKEQIRQETGV